MSGTNRAKGGSLYFTTLFFKETFQEYDEQASIVIEYSPNYAARLILLQVALIIRGFSQSCTFLLDKIYILAKLYISPFNAHNNLVLICI